MATAVFSQHSSNPLEVGSSDPHNKSYLTSYRKARARRARFNSSSDDPNRVYRKPARLKEYQKHIAKLTHGKTRPQTTEMKDTVFVDLDDDMESDDELLRPSAEGETVAVAEDDKLQLDPLIEEDEDVQVEDEDEIQEQEDQMEDKDGYMDEDVMQLPDSDDEEDTFLQKSTEEREEIEQEIAEILEAVPQLVPHYKIIDRLGTGTFSSVYKAIDVNHDKWDNTPWQGHHPPSSSAYYQSMPHSPGSKVFVAIKRIYVTSSPERIRNELSIMMECRGCRHVSQLITAYRNVDQVVVVMPYQCNDDFRDFYRTLSMTGIKAYFRCMFRALRDTHARGIIHRDVKPANFLFDPRTGIGTLCDFGLACRMESGSTLGLCLHTTPSPEHPHGRFLTRNEFDADEIKRAQREARLKSTMPSEKVGYPEKDTRPPSKANRAGTRGFRAPEVLLKCGAQSGAIDVWAAGIILLFFLTKKFPLFQSNDDVEALMEIATIIGRKNMERTATMHSRTFATNVPSIKQEGITWREFVERQNPDLFNPPKPDTRFYPYNNPSYLLRSHDDSDSYRPPPTSSSSPISPTFSDAPASPTREHSAIHKENHIANLEKAFSLLDLLLRPESVKRCTPKEALAHPFLTEADEEDEAPQEDDEFVPHQFGEGVCGEWHFRDEVTEEPCVKVSVVCQCGECDGQVYEEVRTLVAGEGIAIGGQPCEFHRNEFGY